MISTDICFDDYCGLPLLNKGRLSNFLPDASPLNGTVRETTKCMEEGLIFHSLMEHGSLEDNPDIIFSPFDAFRSKEAKEWRAAQSQLVVKEHEVAHYVEMKEVIENKARALGISLEGDSEVTVTNDKYKVRIDRLTDKYLIDWKKCQSAHPRAVSRQIDQMNYDMQAALYSDVYSGEAGGWKDFIFIFIEAKAPYNCTFVSMSEEALTVGRQKIQSALKRYNRLGSENESYVTDVYTYEPPAYRLNQECAFE